MGQITRAEFVSREWFRLVSTGKVKALTQDEKDTLFPEHLFALAVVKLLTLSKRDKTRLTKTQLEVLAQTRKPSKSARKLAHG